MKRYFYIITFLFWLLFNFWAIGTEVVVMDYSDVSHNEITVYDYTNKKGNHDCGCPEEDPYYLFR